MEKKKWREQAFAVLPAGAQVVPRCSKAATTVLVLI